MSLECTNPDCDFTTIGNAGIKICPKCGSDLTFTRSGLFMEQIRLVKEMREKTDGRQPRYMVWENVAGTFSSNKGRDFKAVLEEIAKVKDEDAVIPEPPKGKWTYAGLILGNGWSIAWRVHDAQYFGVPQRRKRICLLADFNGDSAGRILFEFRRKASDGKSEQTVGYSGGESRSEIQSVGKSLSGDTKQGKEERQGASGDVREGFDKTGGIYDVRITSDGTKNWRAHAYSTSICRNLDTGGANPDTNHGGICIVKNKELVTNKDVFVYSQESRAISFQERAGKPGGGKGILIQNEHTGALSTLNNQPVCYYKDVKDDVYGFHLTQDPVSSKELSYAVSCGSVNGQCAYHKDTKDTSTYS